MFNTIKDDLVTAVQGDGVSPGPLEVELAAQDIGALDTDATLQDLQALSFGTSVTLIQVGAPAPAPADRSFPPVVFAGEQNETT